MKRQCVDAHWILIIYLPIMLACSQHPETARHSLSRASDAAATFHPASGSSPFSPSPLSAPSVTNCAVTFPLRCSSGDLTNSMFTSSGAEAEGGSAVDADCVYQRLRESRPERSGFCRRLLAPHGRPQRYFFQLVAKNRSERHYIYEKFSWHQWRPDSSVRLLSQDADLGSHH